jgi:hypothetical protein
MNMDDNNYVNFEETQPEKDNRTTIIIVAVAAVVLLCCCALIVAGWFLGDSIIQALRF